MALKEIELSLYGKRSAEGSPIGRMMEEFALDFRKGIDTNLGVGYVNEDTIPKQLIAEHALETLVHEPLALNYGAAIGQKDLREAIKDFLALPNTTGLTAELLANKEIIIGPNGATSLLDRMAQILPTKTVITSDPCYYIYCDNLDRRGFNLITVPEDKNGIKTDALQDSISKLGQKINDISFFYIVTINNPTCTILSNERRKELVDIVSELSEKIGTKIPIFFDRAYEELIHDESVKPLKSAFLYDRLGIVYEIGTVSKLLAPGLRIGYMVGENGKFLKGMIQGTCDGGFSAPMPNQAIARVMLEQHAQRQRQRVNQGYREKANELKECIDAQLGEYLECYSGGQAGFYFYLTFKDIDTSETSDFFKFLTRTTGNPEIDGPSENKNARVLYIPGEHCINRKGSLVEIGNRQLRLSYGFEETGRIKQAIGLMREAAKYARTQ
jgi:2-aminoadipate transaminase